MLSFAIAGSGGRWRRRHGTPVVKVDLLGSWCQLSIQNCQLIFAYPLRLTKVEITLPVSSTNSKWRSFTKFCPKRLEERCSVQRHVRPVSTRVYEGTSPLFKRSPK